MKISQSIQITIAALFYVSIPSAFADWIPGRYLETYLCSNTLNNNGALPPLSAQQLEISKKEIGKILRTRNTFLGVGIHTMEDGTKIIVIYAEDKRQLAKIRSAVDHLEAPIAYEITGEFFAL